MTSLIVELSALLNKVIEGKLAKTTADVVKLEDSLFLNKKRMVNLLDDLPKKPEHRTALQSGKAVINGKEYRVNEDFIKQTLFLSDHLNLDEYESARLLLDGISQASVKGTSGLDAAVLLYHRERQYVLAILNDILNIAKDTSVENRVRFVYVNFITEILKEKTSAGSFVTRIVQSTKDLSKMIHSITKFGMLESAKSSQLNQPQQPQQTQQLFQQQQPQQQAVANQLSFSPETANFRISNLNEERIMLSQILYHISSLHWLPEDDLIAILTKLQSINLSDSIASYILTALLSSISFDCSYPGERQGNEFSNNEEFLKKLHDHIMNKNWKVDTLKAVVLIQWSLFISILSKSRPTIDQVLSFDKNQRKETVKEAIQLDAFGFMSNYLLYFKQKEEYGVVKKKMISDLNDDDDDSAMAIDGLIVDPNDYTKFNVEISNDFQEYVVKELEYLTQTFILNMPEIFKDLELKCLEEQQMDTSTKEEIENSLTKFLLLLSSIYRDRRDAGLKFWKNQNNGLYSFLGFLVGFKVPQCLFAIFDFFGSISTGVESASHAHAMLKIGTNNEVLSNSNLFSWGKLFSALQLFSKLLKEQSTENEPYAFSTAEEESLCKFLYLCQQVVQYSMEARLEIWENPLLAAHFSIVDMISCQTSKRVRTALYDLLTAFCSNWGGGINDVGRGISLQVWTTLELSNMIISKKVMVNQPTKAVMTTPKKNQPIPNTLFDGYIITPPALPSVDSIKKPVIRQLYLPEQPVGFLREYDEEKILNFYPQTLSVLRLFGSLIHVPSKRDQLVSAFAIDQSSIPPLLGADNHRTPGTSPYISLVIDHVFLDIKNLKFMNPESRWQLTEACLAIIENSIMGLNMEILIHFINECNAKVGSIITKYTDALEGHNPETIDNFNSLFINGFLIFITQPGYDILVRILSGDALIHELFKIVEMGKESVCKSKHDKSNDFRKCMIRCLRIFSKVFQIQNAFVNVLIPQLYRIAKKDTMGNFKLGEYTFPYPPSSFQSLGTLMLYNTEVIVQIALMVNCDDFEDICNFSTLLLADLASQPEDNSNQVRFPNHINVPMGGIGSKLAGILMSSPIASSIILSFSERLAIESDKYITYDDYDYDFNVIPFWLAKETMENIYRFEDFDEKIEQQHISIRITILDMLLDNMSKEIKSPTITEFLLGYDVKELELSGSQLKSLPTDVKHKSQLACLLFILNLIDVQNDESDLEPLIRRNPILAEKCYQLIFKLCARDSTSNATLHYLRNNTDDFLVKQVEAIACRLEYCVQVSEPCFEGILESADKSMISTDYFTVKSVLNQRAWLLKLVALELHKTHGKRTGKLLELLYGLSDNKTTEEEMIERMENMNLQLSSGYQQPLWNMLEIVNSLDFTWIDGLDTGDNLPKVYYKDIKEDDYVIQKDGYVLYDIRTIYKELRWKETNKKAQPLSDSERNAMETEMGSILKRLMAENRNREISYARLHCLRAWKQVIEITISDCFDSFTFESREKIIYDLLSVLLPKLENGSGLHKEILKGLSEVTLSLLARLRQDKHRQAILQIGNASTESRLPDEKLRNIFVSIINCIQKDKTTIEVRSALYSALVNLLQYISPNEEDVLPGTMTAQAIEIVAGERKEKLLEIICNDASQGLEMYKTPAYMALEALYVLVGKSKSYAIHSYLIHKNFLRYTIDMIKRSDDQLYKIIQERDASLIPLYNHEAKFTLFKRIAIKKEGTALLLNNGILNNISGCKFINAQFSRNDLKDAENGYKVDRHDRLLTPILELVNLLLDKSQGQGNEANDFKNWARRQTVLKFILKDEKPQTTLASLYILQLTVSLFYLLSKQADYFLHLEQNGLDEIDTLLMNLISKYCVTEDWSSRVIPSTLEEHLWDKQSVPGTIGNHGSLLVSKADKYITVIRNNLLAYAQASTFRRSEVFKPIFANTLVPIKESISTLTNRVTPTVASLSTLVGCLTHTGKQLSKVISDYQILLGQKENVNSLKYEEIIEISQTAIPEGLGIKYDSLNPTQQSQVLSTEINHRIQLKSKEIQDLNFTIETAVFILWRHLEFYLKRDSISSNVTLSPCERYANETVVLLQQALYQTSPTVIQQLKSSCVTILEPIIEKLESLPNTTHTSSLLNGMYRRLRRCYQ